MALGKNDMIQMESRIAITTNDYQRLVEVMDLSALKAKAPDMVNALSDMLTRAKKLPQENIADGVITMNSKVHLRDVKSGREIEVTLTYPQDADPRERRISVFSEIGVALLGRSEGDKVSWKIPGGLGFFDVVRVTYQPEAAGHYYL